MRRGYTRESYLEIIRKITECGTALIAISTDIIVGFPGETNPTFRILSVCSMRYNIDSAFSFKYSPRPNTAALRLPDELPEEEKGRRLEVLQEHQRQIQYKKNTAYLGRIMEVLVDDKARSRFSLAGRTSNNKIVNFDGPEALMGQIVQVEITGFSPNSLKGVWIHSEDEKVVVVA